MTKNDGGPAFPLCVSGVAGIQNVNLGMSLRDWLAGSLDSDAINDLIYQNLSRDAKAKILGEEYPDEPHRDKHRSEHIAFQIKRFDWEMRLHAKLCYMMADAMLAARKEPDSD